MGAARRIVLLAVAGLAIIAAVSWVALRSVRHAKKDVRAPELPERIPNTGLVVSRLYGRETPAPVPFYPGGRIYGSDGSDLRRGKSGGEVVVILEGAYASPKAIAQYYRAVWRKHHIARPWVYPDYAWFGIRPGVGGIDMAALTDPAGYTRDFSKWVSKSGDENDIIGGDPREAMIMITVRWPKWGPGAPELPKRIPNTGLVVSRLYGIETPVPLPFYPGGRIYGSALRPKKNTGGKIVYILQGAYASPKAIMQYYQAAWKEHCIVIDNDYPNYVYFRIEAEGGSTAVSALTDPAGLSRDFEKWFLPDSDERKLIGGDPEEAMITIIVRWPKGSAALRR